jgi:hypothetical protein
MLPRLAPSPMPVGAGLGMSAVRQRKCEPNRRGELRRLASLVRWLGRSHSALDFTSPAQFEKTVAE